MTYIKVEHLALNLGRPLFSNLNFSVNPGDVALLSGPNGCGKSSVVRCLVDQLAYASGNIIWGIDRSDAFYLPQQMNHSFHIPLSLGDVIRLFTPTVDDSDLRQYGLLQNHQLDLLWQNSSGGEKMRTLLAAALTRHPKVLLLDEPTNHLDASTSELLATALGKYMASASKPAVVLISHDQTFLSTLQRQGFKPKLIAIDGGGDE